MCIRDSCHLLCQLFLAARPEAVIFPENETAGPIRTRKVILALSLIHIYGCSVETADIEFAWTRRHAIDKGTNLGRHLIQAFQPGEVTPEQALSLIHI